MAHQPELSCPALTAREDIDGVSRKDGEQKKWDMEEVESELILPLAYAG